jgi:hypothetical protein
MAKEEKSEIGISKGLATTILLVIAVISAASFWFDRGGTEAKAEANHYSIVGSHENRLTKVESGLSTVIERQTSIEKTQISLTKDQQSILSGQREMKVQRSEDMKLLREQRTEDSRLLRDQRSEDMKFRTAQQRTIAELNAYLRTIDKIE